MMMRSEVPGLETVGDSGLAIKTACPREVANMVEQEELELTSSQEHTKIATICRATIHESDLKTNRKDLLQLMM